MISIHRYEDANSFIDESDVWLRTRLVENNNILSVAGLLTRENHYQEPVYVATAKDGSIVCGCAICPPPDGLYLSRMPEKAIPIIANELNTVYDSILQVVGPAKETLRFAQCWKKQDWKLHSTHQWYALRAVTPPKHIAPGALQIATVNDLPLVESWAPKYAQEVDTKVDVRELFRLMISRGLMYLWVDKEPRCLVTVSGLTPDTARISSLYTPPDDRGNGYAINAVAQCSLTILETGRSICIASADISAPGPMQLYRRVGYKPDEQFVLVHFE